MEKLGALLIDKPAGMTSHDAVNLVRRALKQKRVGHTGTLDPFATGLLIICLGKATRLAQFLTGEDKRYEAVVRFGFSTDTQDYTGKPITPLISSDVLKVVDLARVLNDFTGTQWQLPPMFSAKKVGGEALYKRARRGEVVERQAARVVIERLELMQPQLTINANGTADARIFVECSAGTYIRTLAHDLGERLGSGAHLIELRRVAVGKFSLEHAIALDRLPELTASGEIESSIIAPADMVGWLPAIPLDEQLSARVRQGQQFGHALAASLAVQAWVRLIDHEGRLVAMAQVVADQDRRYVQPRILIA